MKPRVLQQEVSVKNVIVIYGQPLCNYITEEVLFTEDLSAQCRIVNKLMNLCILKKVFERFAMVLFKRKVLHFVFIFLLTWRYVVEELVRRVLITVGVSSTILGSLGAIPGIPLPTVPFLILAGLCFKRSSPSLHYWLRNLKYLGPVLRTWQDKKQISVRTKIIAVVSLMFSFVFVFFLNESILFISAFFVLAVTVSLYIITRKSE